MASFFKKIVAPLTAGVTDVVGDIWGDLSGANKMADAAERSALAQQAEARKQRDQAMDLAQATPQELQAFNRQLTAAEKNLERQERMIAAIDPAIMEASEQVLALLRGEESGMTKAANEQRARQRQELVNSLRARYGPGAEESSLGRRILDQFDSETNMITQQQQQGALAQVFGIAGQGMGLADSSGALGALQTAGQNFSNLQGRQLNAHLGMAAPQIQAAGAQYVGDAVRAQSQMQLFNAAANAGFQFLGGKLAGMGGAGSTFNGANTPGGLTTANTGAGLNVMGDGGFFG